MELPTLELDTDFGSPGDESKLPAVWLEAALKNVNDDPKLRKERIKKLRKRLKEENMSLRPGTDVQMLGVLRAASCDVEGAVEVAKAFLVYQQYCKNATPSKTEEMILDNVNLFMVLPNRDKYGRRVIVYRMWDGVKYPYSEIMNMFYVLCLTLAREPKTQIAGITLVGDMSGMSRKHIPSTWSDMTSWATFMKGGAPAWFHQCHILNFPWFFQPLYAMAKPLMNERAYGNVVIHKKADTLDALYEHIPKSILPSEFGGDAGPTDNTKCFQAAMKLEPYFVELLESKQN